MNFSIILKLLGVILLTLTFCFCISFGVEWMMADSTEHPVNTVGWIICIAVSASLSWLFYMLGYKGHTRMFRREAMATIGLGWLLAANVGALPYLLVHPTMEFADAFFESASGLTTTGASIVDDFDAISPGLMFWRCLSQWIGGLGVVVFFVALLSFLGAGAKILYSNEASAQANELETSRVQVGVLRIFGVYLTLSIACLIAYHLAGMSWYEATVHMFTTLSTGGFGAYSSSMAYFNSPLIEWLCILFMVLGGTSFLVMLRMTKCKLVDYRQFTEIQLYYGIILVAATTISLLLLRELQWDWSQLHTVIRSSMFQVVSIMTTSGFSTVDFELWVPAAHIILLILMIFGGCSGSTSGGVKVVRLIVAFKVCLRQIERSYRSRVVRPIKINGRVMEESVLDQSIVFLVLAAGVCILSILLLAILEPTMSPMGVVSAVFASFFNIGPGLNEVGPAHSFSFLSDTSKVFLSLLMILGRLELYALLALMMPGMWKRFT